MKIDFKCDLWLKYEKQKVIGTYFPSQHERSRKSNRLSFTAVMRTSEANSNHPTNSTVKLASRVSTYKLLLKDAHVCCITGTRTCTHARTPFRTIECSQRAMQRGGSSPPLPPSPRPFVCRWRACGIIARWCRKSTMQCACCQWVRNLLNRSVDMTPQSILCAHRRYPSEQKCLEIPPKYLTYSRPFKLLLLHTGLFKAKPNKLLSYLVRRSRQHTRWRHGSHPRRSCGLRRGVKFPWENRVGGCAHATDAMLWESMWHPGWMRTGLELVNGPGTESRCLNAEAERQGDKGSENNVTTKWKGGGAYWVLAAHNLTSPFMAKPSFTASFMARFLQPSASRWDNPRPSAPLVVWF